MGALAMWDHHDLTVLIDPPLHGPIYNSDTGLLGGNDPSEVGLGNSYLRAIEAAIQSWADAVDLLGADWLKDVYNPEVYVLGRDEVPQDVLLAPDILVVADENEGPLLGTAYRTDPCVIRMSMSWTESFSYADMFNVTAQEFGHCLGLQHVGAQGGFDPMSERKHPEHDVMNGSYSHRVGEKGTHLHCVSNLNVLGLEHVFSLIKQPYPILGLGEEGITHMPEQIYGDTCNPPPPDWRERTIPLLMPGAPLMRSEIRSPSSGSRIKPGTFREVSGTASIERNPGHRENVDYQAVIQVALARIGGHGTCDWWDPSEEAFVTRDCYSPPWSAAVTTGDDSWVWEAPRALPAGNYRAISRISTPYGHEACCDANFTTFRILRTRKA